MTWAAADPLGKEGSEAKSLGVTSQDNVGWVGCKQMTGRADPLYSVLPQLIVRSLLLADPPVFFVKVLGVQVPVDIPRK